MKPNQAEAVVRELVSLITKVIGYSAKEAKQIVADMRENDPEFERSVYMTETVTGVRGHINRITFIERTLEKIARDNDEDGRLTQNVREFMFELKKQVNILKAKEVAVLLVPREGP